MSAGRIAGIVFCWLLGTGLTLTHVLDISHAALLAGVLTGLILAWPVETADAPRLPDQPFRSRPGARRDLSYLSWSVFTSDGLISAPARDRLDRLADEAHCPELPPRAGPAQVRACLTAIELKGPTP